MNLEIDHRPYDQIIDIMDSTNQASDDDNDDFNLHSVLGDQWSCKEYETSKEDKPNIAIDDVLSQSLAIEQVEPDAQSNQTTTNKNKLSFILPKKLKFVKITISKSWQILNC